MSTEAQITATPTETTENQTATATQSPGDNGADAATTPPAKPGDKPGEKKDEQKPDPLAKAKAKVAAIRARAREHKEKSANESKTAAELAALRTELAESKRATTALKSLAELAEKDPYRAMQHLGITPDGLMKHGTPEAQQERTLAEIAKRAEAAEERAKALEKQIKDEKIATVIENDKRQVREALAGEDYPHVSALPERLVFVEVDRIRNDAHRETGEWYPVDEVLALLEDEYSTAASQKKTAATQKPQNGIVGRAPGDAKAPKSRTLTNSQASVSNTAPPDLNSLTKQQREERLTLMLRDRFKNRRPA